ncbi:MAG: zinc-dependent metalloprotease, partial [Bacteroidales bacterium]|nr:zinc-dependent metalloprotease [Bacteroidales bacterium]
YFKIKKTQYIRKWKLEPRDPDAYHKGILTEPVSPIVFYIDPATSKKLIPYFKMAVEDWQPAFEAAGFKNAIIAKEVPSKEEDPDWDAMDARYSMINYLASEEQNAYGPHVADPRTGEIIEAHVCIYHNVMQLLNNWYIIQTAGSNPGARKLTLSDEVMGALYRQAVCHEVGHSLGLPHNFAASGAIPVDSLRSPSFTDKFGTTMSIMDYARYNYIAQPGDGVKRYIPIVGPYDKYNINWAYRVIPGANTPEEEVPALDRIVEEKLGDRTYLYIKHSLTQKDPRGQTEDLGDDAVKANGYALKNLRYVVENFDKWLAEPGESYDNIKEFYQEIFKQWRRYIGHVNTSIGGLYENYQKQSQSGPAYSPVERDKQIESLNFIIENVFEFPQWLIRRDLIEKFDDSGMYERNIRGMQAAALVDILSNASLNRLAEISYNHPDSYRIEDLFETLRSYLFKELLQGKETDIYKKGLQKTYLDRLKYLGPKNPDADKRDMGVNILLLTDVQTCAWNELTALKKDLERAIKRYPKGSIMRAHIELMIRDLNIIKKIE